MKSQRGMTMVELIIAVTITGVIVVFLGTAITQIVNISSYGNDKFTAMHELQNAAYWFNKDGQESIAATPSTNQVIFKLADNSTITYKLTSTNLERLSGTNQLILAQNINSVVFTVNGRLTTMKLVSAPEGRISTSENATYMVYLRPVGG